MTDFIFLGSKITTDGDCSHKIKRHFFLGRTAMSNLDSVLKKRHHIANKGPYSQSYHFYSSRVWMWELDHKEGWVPKKWCFRIVVLEKTLESFLDSEEIKPVNPKGNQPWIFIGRADAEAENSSTLATWCKELTHWKRSWSWEDWRQKEKGWQSRRWLDSITDSMNVNLRQLWTIVKDSRACCAAAHWVAKSWTGLRDWTTTTTLGTQQDGFTRKC